MCPALHQGVDHPPQGQQGLVDEPRLLGTRIDRARAAHIFAAGQVDEVQAASAHRLLSVRRGLPHVHGDGEDGVGAGGLAQMAEVGREFWWKGERTTTVVLQGRGQGARATPAPAARATPRPPSPPPFLSVPACSAGSRPCVAWPTPGPAGRARRPLSPRRPLPGPGPRRQRAFPACAAARRPRRAGRRGPAGRRFPRCTAPETCT